MRIIGTITEYESKEEVLKVSDVAYLKEVRKTEEEIGISVIDFFKLRKAEKLYLPRFKAYYEIVGIDLKTLEIIVQNKRKKPAQHTLKIRNFGRTWLFRKEKSE